MYNNVFQDIVWPSITICNLNQVEASFMKDVEVHGNIELTDLLINEFILGRMGNLSEEHKQTIDRVKQRLGPDFTFNEWSRQKCKDLFISTKFREKMITWRDVPQDWQNLEGDPGPYIYATDFGACCYLCPHLNLDPWDWNKTYAEMYHGLEADALNGDSNGLDLVLDAEQFNYAYYKVNAPGFKISFHQKFFDS